MHSKRDLIRFLLKDEEAVAKETEKYKALEIREVTMGTVNGISLRLAMYPPDIDRSPYLVQSVRYVDGQISINVDIDTLITSQVCAYKDVWFFKASVAHEIGHIEMGHLNNDQTAHQQNHHDIDFLTYQTDNKNYMQIYCGYVIREEFEADIKAMEYVPVQDIINMHLVPMRGGKQISSFAAKMEKVNRLVHYANMLLNDHKPTKNLKFSINDDFLKQFPYLSQLKNEQ